jgi:type I restriction enzyme S subunit
LHPTHRRRPTAPHLHVLDLFLEFPDLFLEHGDVLFNRTNSAELVGKTAVYRGVPKPCSFASYLIRLRLEGAMSEWLSYYLNSPFGRSQINAVVSQQVGQANVNGTKLKAFQIPLPPLAEQRRIVAKIEELFSELDAGEESLRRARRQLGVYRQSLLKQAFEGKLTAHWRKQNPQLLSKPLGAATRLDVEPGPLPSEWIWQTLNEVAEISGGLTKNSKRDNLPLRIPYLRVANVYANELRLEEIKDIGVTPAEAKKVQLVKGDLLIVEGNGSLDQIGRVAEWNGSMPDCGHQNHLIRARCMPQAHHTFVLMFLLSPHGRAVIEKQAASTSGLHTLSVSKVQRLPVPLCTLPEQQEIVRLLDEQFTVIEQNEREIAAALKRSAALRQSILKKAFTGQLVPQDPTDEPASALLERIRKERDVAESTSKKKITRKKSLIP